MFTVHDNYFDALRAAEPGKHILRVDTLYLVQTGNNEDFHKCTAALLECNEAGCVAKKYLRLSDLKHHTVTYD